MRIVIEAHEAVATAPSVGAAMGELYAFHVSIESSRHFNPLVIRAVDAALDVFKVNREGCASFSETKNKDVGRFA